MKKYIKCLLIAGVMLVSACGDSEFDRRAAKYGFNTEEERTFLCFGIGMYNDEINIRLTAAAMGIAYSRYLQVQKTGKDSGNLTQEHSALQTKGTAAWEKMTPEDIKYLSENCEGVIKNIAPKISTQLQDTMGRLGL